MRVPIKKAASCMAVALATAALAPMLAVGTAHADAPDIEHMAQQHGNSGEAGHGHGGGGGGSGSVNLVDHGGPILPSAHLYAIWWGPTSGWPADTQPGLTNFLTGFGSSQLLQVSHQYMRGASVSTAYVRSFSDTSAPTSRPGTATIASEIQTVLNANGVAADPNGVYFVFTTNFPHGANYCAWHAGATVNSTAVAEAYMPNTTNIGGCDPGSQYDGTGYSEGTRSIANVTSHELMEAITDKTPGGSTTAWIDGQGEEIGDKCAWTFTGGVQVGSQTWQLQQEWSNAVSGCVQQ